MCVVSMIGEHYGDKLRREWPQFFPDQQPRPLQVEYSPFVPAPVSRQEFEELKRQVSEMTELLRRAKVYDEKHGEPDCEIEEKMAALRAVARIVGVDLDAALNREVTRG